MTFDDAVDAFIDPDTFPATSIDWVLKEWDETGPRCRALLRAYVDGADFSERTEQALYVILHLLGERQDQASFPDLCRLALDADRCHSVLGDDGMAALPAMLISTFDGDRVPLHRLVEAEEADELLRGEALLSLAYLARSGRFPESEMYRYLADCVDRLQPRRQYFVWAGWVRAVAALGFAGLSSRAEQLFQAGLIDPTYMNSADFWGDLRDAQADPGGMSGQAWEGIGPIGQALDWLQPDADQFDSRLAAAEPLRNPLRNVGRNDACPCGSGKKYKKCCLAA